MCITSDWYRLDRYSPSVLSSSTWTLVRSAEAFICLSKWWIESERVPGKYNFRSEYSISGKLTLLPRVDCTLTVEHSCAVSRVTCRCVYHKQVKKTMNFRIFKNISFFLFSLHFFEVFNFFPVRQRQ